MDTDEHEEPRYIPRTGPMFSRGSLAKAELATDLAIYIVAEGGWSALTLRNVAKAANVTPQAIAAWFPSVRAMRVAVASRYGDRWIRNLGYLAGSRVQRLRAEDQPVELPALAAAFLPASWLESVFHGIWLSITEAGRWDDAIGRLVADVQQQERDLVEDLVHGTQYDVDLVLAVVRGRRTLPWRD